MKELAIRVGALLLFILALIALSEIRHNSINKKLCADSKYKTTEYEISESNRLYCKVDNVVHELKKRNL